MACKSPAARLWRAAPEPRHLASTAAAAAVCAVLFAGGTPARAAAPDPVAVFTTRAIAPWPGHQLRDGSFPDYIRALTPTNSDRYGEAMLAAAMIRQGMKVGSRPMVASGVKALGWVLRRRPRSDSATRRFEDLAVVEAWLAVSRPGSRVRIPRALADAWRADISRITIRPTERLWGMPRNQAFVDQLIALELASTGLKSRVAGSVLSNPTAWRATAAASLDKLLEDPVLPVSSLTPSGPALLLGDPFDFPPAYHALTLAVLARATKFLSFDPETAATVRTRLAAAVNAAALAMAPDGDFAYSGRSPEEAWALATLIAGERQSLVGCGDSCPPAGAAGRIDGLAARRLADLHTDAKWGIRLVPSQAAGIRTIRTSFDDYVSATSYTGLALLALTWAGYTAPPSQDPWEQPSAVAVGAGRGGFGVRSTADTWFAVRSGSMHADQRLASGLVATKALVGGKWTDIVVAPPARFTNTNSYGPLAINGWDWGAMTSPAVSTTETGLGLTGSFVDRSGTAIEGAVAGDVLYEPVQCGVRMTMQPQAGVAVALAFAVPAARLADAGGGALEWDSGTVTAGPGSSLRWEAVGPTAAAAATSRVFAGARAGESSPVVVTVQAKGCAS